MLMKKIFTLIATALLTMGASAQTTVFSATPLQDLTENWSTPTGETEITATYATISGGKMFTVNEQDAAKEMIKKQGGEYAFQCTNNNTYFKVVLSEALQAGDVISARLQSRTDTDLGLFFAATSTRPSETTTAIILPTAAEQAWTEAPSYTVATGDGICGETTFYMFRATGKSTYFNTFAITRGGGGGGGTTPEVWSASSLTFDPDTKILQEAVKSENKSASYVIPEDAKVFPEDTWKTADETGDISVVSDWLAAQSNPSLYATPLKEYTFTASTASVSMKAVSTPNTDSSEAEAWQNAGGETSNVALNTDACAIKWTNYVKPKTGNPSLGYYDFYDATSTGGTAHRVYDQLWKIGCGKVPEKGTYYEFTFAKAGSMIMGVFMNRPNQSAVVVIDKETLAPLAVDKLSFEGFCQNNKFKYPVDGEESTDPTYQKFNFREDYTIDVSAQSGRPLLGYLSFPVEAKTYFVFQPKSQVGIYGFQFTPGGDPAGVETIKTEKVWNANAPMYNLSGQQVDKSYKGIVIQNGRKFVNK